MPTASTHARVSVSWNFEAGTPLAVMKVSSARFMRSAASSGALSTR